MINICLFLKLMHLKFLLFLSTASASHLAAQSAVQSAIDEKQEDLVKSVLPTSAQIRRNWFHLSRIAL
jgi:hypothetical protein